MKLVLVFAFLPICLGLVTEENCMNLVDNFMSIINGSNLNVCSVPKLQCCSQSNEDALGMTLNDALNLNSTNLGSELSTMRGNIRALYPALTDLRLSLINDVLGPLMNTSADLTIGNQINYNDDLERIREEILSNINYTIAGTLNVDLTSEISRFFIEGLITLYFNATFEPMPSTVSGIDAMQRNCSIMTTYNHFFPPTEQAKIAALGGRLQQIAVAYEVVRETLQSLQAVLTALDEFTATRTCTNVWTLQYACPRCAGQTASLCLGRCEEVLIGCMSSLQQVIVQVNVLLDFIRGSVNSLISGYPHDDINVNTIADDYARIFDTIQTLERDYLTLSVPEICEFSARKRSVDDPTVRHKRQAMVMINLASVTINQSIVTVINDTLLPPVMNVSLYNDRRDLCDSLNSSGLVNCTNGVDNIGNSTTPTVGAEIDDQVDNTAGAFDLAQLREQARPLPYVMTDLLNRSDIMMLYENVLPGRPVPNLDFLTEPTTTTTTTSSVVPSATVATASPTPTGTGGSAAISYSLFITLAALLLASVL